MNHKQLVKRAAEWLRLRGHTIVITELRTLASETPDAYGYKGGVSTIIECKASRSDFLADKKKRFRVCPEYGMGDKRYYMVPKGLVSESELPAGWGLLEVSDKQVRHARGADKTRANKDAETILLASVIRRLEISTAVFVRQESEDQS